MYMHNIDLSRIHLAVDINVSTTDLFFIKRILILIIILPFDFETCEHPSSLLHIFIPKLSIYICLSILILSIFHVKESQTLHFIGKVTNIKFEKYVLGNFLFAEMWDWENSRYYKLSIFTASIVVT